MGDIGIGVVDAWREYAELLGTRVIAHEDGLAMKIDERPFRVVARPAESNEGLAFAGWELPNATALEICAAELEAAGFDIVRGSTAECEQRRARESISTIEPGGFTVEFFHGLVHDHGPTTGANRPLHHDVYPSTCHVYTARMTKRLIDVDDEALDAARAQLGTHTIKDTVNEALRRAARRRNAELAGALAVLADADLEDRSEAWR